jgi:hypothetical protein
LQSAVRARVDNLAAVAGHQVEAQKDKADVVIPPVRELGFIQPCHVNTLHVTFAVRGPVNAGALCNSFAPRGQ